MDNPNLYIIAGCNGAGKTTASMTVLPDVLGCEEFVNADEIAKGLSPFHPEEMAIEAGKWLKCGWHQELLPAVMTFLKMSSTGDIGLDCKIFSIFLRQ